MGDANILIVDDERPLADLYSGWLSDEYCTRVIYEGAEAIDYVDGSVDIALLDRRMPGTTGDEVLGEIRSRNLPCRVAMVTAVEPGFDVVEMGFDDYVTKPVSKDQLREVVDSLVLRRRYDDRVQELFSLASKRRALEAEMLDSELAAHEEYAELVRRIDDLEAELDGMIHEFDGDDFRALSLTLGDSSRPESPSRSDDPEGGSGGDGPSGGMR